MRLVVMRRGSKEAQQEDVKTHGHQKQNDADKLEGQEQGGVQRAKWLQTNKKDPASP